MSVGNIDFELSNVNMPSSGAILKVNGADALFAWGPDVPDGDPGYAIGCLFIHTDGTAGTVLYANEGTASSCDFDAVTVT